MYYLDECKLRKAISKVPRETQHEWLFEQIKNTIKHGKNNPWLIRQETQSGRKRHFYSEEFEEFWKMYPRKEAKGAAYSVWKTLCKEFSCKELLDSCKATLTWQLKSENFMTYTPHPQTYLRQRRFEDEPPVQKQTTGKVDMNGMPI